MTDVVGEELGGVALVTLEEAKAHLRVDFADDDTLIETYVAAAEAVALGYVNRGAVPDGERARSAFRVAVLMLTGDLYTYRETGQVGSVSSEIKVLGAAKMLLDPYRVLTV